MGSAADAITMNPRLIPDALRLPLQRASGCQQRCWWQRLGLPDADLADHNNALRTVVGGTAFACVWAGARAVADQAAVPRSNTSARAWVRPLTGHEVAAGKHDSTCSPSSTSVGTSCSSQESAENL
jgi:hypothetical protein